MTFHSIDCVNGKTYNSKHLRHMFTVLFYDGIRQKEGVVRDVFSPQIEHP